MKTIQELEAELVGVEKIRSELWEQVKVARDAYDNITKEWAPYDTRAEKLKFQIETRKELEAGQ